MVSNWKVNLSEFTARLISRQPFTSKPDEPEVFVQHATQYVSDTLQKSLYEQHSADSTKTFKIPYFSSWRRITLEKLIVAQPDKNPPISWNTQRHYRFHTTPPNIPLLSRINPVKNIPSYFFKTYFNVTLQSTAKPSKRSLTFWFPHQTLHIFLLSPPQVLDAPPIIILID